ncbi:MAG: hypothetical protein ACTSSN_05950 [Candidatus Heimdallarchaeaceae archaeon]
MINSILLYIGSGLIIVWGIAHIFPTKSIVKGFGEISKDNKLIITMEWIAEGITFIFIGTLVVFVTVFGDVTTLIPQIVFWISSAVLLIMAILSYFTGARVPVIPMKLCPVIKTIVAILFLVGSLLKV